MGKISFNTVRGLEKTSRREFAVNKAVKAIERIDAELVNIDTDIAALPSATNAELKAIIGNMLAREEKTFRTLRSVIRFISLLAR